GSGRGLDRCSSGVRSETYLRVQTITHTPDSTTVPPPFPSTTRRKPASSPQERWLLSPQLSLSPSSSSFSLLY
ncbi:unnamed protein product, partial [Musa textilis]